MFLNSDLIFVRNKGWTSPKDLNIGDEVLCSYICNSTPQADFLSLESKETLIEKEARFIKIDHPRYKSYVHNSNCIAVSHRDNANYYSAFYNIRAETLLTCSDRKFTNSFNICNRKTFFSDTNKLLVAAYFLLYGSLTESNVELSIVRSNHLTMLALKLGASALSRVYKETSYVYGEDEDLYQLVDKDWYNFCEQFELCGVKNLPLYLLHMSEDEFFYLSYMLEKFSTFNHLTNLKPKHLVMALDLDRYNKELIDSLQLLFHANGMSTYAITTSKGYNFINFSRLHDYLIKPDIHVSEELLIDVELTKLGTRYTSSSVSFVCKQDNNISFIGNN